MTDFKLNNRLASAEHLIELLLVNGAACPRKLARMFPPVIRMDDEILDRAEAIWKQSQPET